MAASLLLASCATTSLPSIGAEGKAFQMEEDEGELWRNAEQLERRLEKSGILYKDDKLEEYLNAVAQKLLDQNLETSGATPRMKVIQNPLLNAFALPHGTIYLHTGMLARMENEAQLASLLGHELTHFTHRHAVKEMRSARNRAAFLTVLQVMLIGAGAAVGLGPVGEMAGELTGLWGLASVRGYSRELETEADEEGLRAMIEAGYDANEAPKIFEHLRQEMDERKVKEPFFFGTHPRLQERIENYPRLLGTRYTAQAMEEGRRKNSDEFLRSILHLLLDNAILDLEIGRYKTAQAAIEKHLKEQAHSARGHFLLGEVLRRSGQGDPHTQRAIAAYREAVRLDSTYPEPHRELGLLYRAQNDHEHARSEFERYLALSPTAVDAPIIRGYLEELQKP